MPSIETGNPKEIEAVAVCMLEQAKRGRASASALKLLAARALQECSKRELSPPPALTEIAAHLLEPKIPRHMRTRPEARQRAIAYMVKHPKAGRRAIAKAAGVG